MDPEDNIQLPIIAVNMITTCILMSVHPQDTFSNKFWNYRDTLSIENGLITCGSRIIVPHEMRAEMLQYIHEGHQGKERCLLQARNTVFWPKITYDIQELTERCIICQEHGKSQSIIGTTQELPLFPWHTLATDIFY